MNGKLNIAEYLLQLLVEKRYALGLVTLTQYIEDLKRLTWLNRPITALNLTWRPNHCLLGEGIQFIGEVAQKTRAELLKIDRVGKKSLDEIEKALAMRGLALDGGRYLRSADGERWLEQELVRAQAEYNKLQDRFYEIVQDLDKEYSDAVSKLLALLDCPIDDLNLSSYAETRLKVERIRFIGGLLQETEAGLSQRPNIGQKVLDEVKKVLGDRGLHLGMKNMEWWTPPDSR